MGTKAKELIKIYILWLLGGLLLIYLALEVHSFFIVFIFVLFLYCAWLTRNVRCHECGWSLVMRPLIEIELDKPLIYGALPWLPSKCPNCGEKVK
ncbi:conserved hypothetical protein [Nitrospina gracilis 3/211]|uniref:Uncharacterized protein n=1 Tax=Nitrospina gracilis (strain 3/211) TaxID=1266370 RepID=M1YVU6_NITG3|nr:conserved hypothetical protein [Nitrospina gracilis 3/211]